MRNTDYQQGAPVVDLPTTPSHQPDDRSLYLIGRPKMRHFLRFVRHHAVEHHSEAALIAEWQEAEQQVIQLQKDEPGRADNPEILPIDPESKYREQLVAFLADPLVQNGFNTVPTELAFVPLDKLVVYQKHIDMTFVAELQSRLGEAPSGEEIFRTCLPYHHPRPEAKWTRLGSDGYVFVSRSNDLRFLEAMPLEPEQVTDYPHPGVLLGVVGLSVGFGTNFLNAVYYKNRLVLNNGSHRAYALKEMGVTHVPCVVQRASTKEELEHVITSAVSRNTDDFFKQPRPPMLTDYLNPALRKVIPAHRVQRQVRLRYSVSEEYVPVV